MQFSGTANKPCVYRWLWVQPWHFILKEVEKGQRNSRELRLALHVANMSSIPHHHRWSPAPRVQKNKIKSPGHSRYSTGTKTIKKKKLIKLID